MTEEENKPLDSEDYQWNEEVENSLVNQSYYNTEQRGRTTLQRLMEACGEVIVGQTDVLEQMLICMVAGGHVLLEGVPGIAKTLIAKTLSQAIDATFSRIQFTPDLMPSDIIGTSIYNMKESTFVFKPGPIFGNLILIDEINRAPAKTQSALFEVMEERQVSYDGITYPFEFPFIVIATQNPVEQEGTYRLPEAQLDRFMMKIVLDYPSLKEEVIILDRFHSNMDRTEYRPIDIVISPDDLKELQKQAEAIKVEPQMFEYIAKLIQATRNHASIFLGASPRASLAVLHASKVAALFAGRDFVIPDDIQYVAPSILNHRITLNANVEMSGVTQHQVIDEIIKGLEVPR